MDTIVHLVRDFRMEGFWDNKATDRANRRKVVLAAFDTPAHTVAIKVSYKIVILIGITYIIIRPH